MKFEVEDLDFILRERGLHLVWMCGAVRTACDIEVDGTPPPPPPPIKPERIKIALEKLTEMSFTALSGSGPLRKVHVEIRPRGYKA